MTGEINCHNCVGACCKGPLVMSLSAPEYTQMLDAGSDLTTIAEPEHYDRSAVIYPNSLLFDTETGEAHFGTEPGRETEPLPAGMGRYLLMGTCGNLIKFLGRESCGIYSTRPRVCREFVVDSPDCHTLRQNQGIDHS